jgi:hypothetical protein
MYYIVGKDHDKEMNSNLSTYWELGWEVATMHLLVKRKLKEGEIKQEDTIVTRSGLEFLYSNVFKNVINYSTFLENHSNEEKIEMLNQGYNMGYSSDNSYSEFYVDNNNKNLYKYYEEDRDFILNIKTIDCEHLHENKEYCVVVYRQRPHDSYRNSNLEFYKNLIDTLKTKYSKIFVAGIGSELFCNNNDIVYVNLQEYTSLINSNLCKLLVTPLTGLYILAILYSKSENAVLLDHNDSEVFSLQHSKNHFVGIGFCIKYSTSNWKYFKKKNINNPDEIFTKTSEL